MEQIKNVISTFSSDKAAKITRLILFSLLAWALGKLAWGGVNTPRVIAPQIASARLPSTNAVIDYNLSDTLKYHLFGRYLKQASIKIQKPNLDDLPLIRMNLKLVGVVASTNEERSTAIIAYQNSQGVYGINDPIKGTRVNVRYILSDRVILDNNGRDETLMLEGVDFTRSSKNNVFLPPLAKQPQQNKPQKSETLVEGALSNIRQEILKNPQSLLKYITLSQERQNDEVLGYRLGPGNDKRLFEHSGLQKGDIATEINNVDLTDPAQMNKIWNNLKEASEISLSVLRNGQTHHINIGL